MRFFSHNKGCVALSIYAAEGDRLISILRTKSEVQGDAAETIVSMPIEQIQVAEFEAGGTAVFVISDLTEIENMQIARVISKRPTA